MGLRCEEDLGCRAPAAAEDPDAVGPAARRPGLLGQRSRARRGPRSRSSRPDSGRDNERPRRFPRLHRQASQAPYRGQRCALPPHRRPVHGRDWSSRSMGWARSRSAGCWSTTATSMPRNTSGRGRLAPSSSPRSGSLQWLRSSSPPSPAGCGASVTSPWWLWDRRLNRRVGELLRSAVPGSRLRRLMWDP
jgi:hypothetical protein